MTKEREKTMAPTWSAVLTSISTLAAIIAVILSIHIWNQSKPTRKPIFAPRGDKSIHEESQTQNKLLINLYLSFLNIGKHPAKNVRFRSCVGPLSDPNQLKLTGIDQTSANTIYPENEYNPWIQLTVEGTDLTKILKSSFFYYCRLDYQDPWGHDKGYNQDFYFIYNIDRKKLQDATSEHKQRFQKQINRLLEFESLNK